jgi:HEPN domain-containing protein
MATQADLARGYMLKGDSDRLNAERTVQSAGPYDTACFHCQQAVEKYLKAILAFAGQPIPRTHDLEDIYDLCLQVAPALDVDRTELSSLTPYAVQLRYDADFWPDQATGQQALEVANHARAAIQAFLPPSNQP